MQRLADVAIGLETRRSDVRTRASPVGRARRKNAPVEKAREQPGNELELSDMIYQKEATVTIAPGC